MDKSLSDIDQKKKIKEVKLDQIWQILSKYCDWNSLMGTSIQPDPKENSKPEVSFLLIIFILKFFKLNSKIYLNFNLSRVCLFLISF